MSSRGSSSSSSGACDAGSAGGRADVCDTGLAGGRLKLEVVYHVCDAGLAGGRVRRGHGRRLSAIVGRCLMCKA